MKINVLDKGYVMLVDSMGSDKDIVNAARVSYDKDDVWSKTMEDGDEKLLRYLVCNHHSTPFEMCELKFEMKLPIFVARQIIRHRTANVNEISGRYTEFSDDEYYLPDSFREQSKSNKQGSGREFNDPHGFHTETFAYSISTSISSYKTMVDANMAKEMARCVLPLSTYTKWVWKMDLRNLLHFLKLRLHPHAQLETREYAKAIAEIVQQKFPITWEAFVDYQLEAETFSRAEMRLLKEMAYGFSKNEVTMMLKFNNIELSDREKIDFCKKLGIEKI